MARALFQEDFQHLGDDVARALDDDAVADLDVQALDLVKVVESGVRHSHPADRDGAEFGDRGDRPQAADGGDDVHDFRLRLLGGKLIGHGPARRLVREARLGAQVKGVQLDHGAVDVVEEQSRSRSSVRQWRMLSMILSQRWAS